MTEEDFRGIALSMGSAASGGAVEGSHIGNADFRVVGEGGKVGKIFATIPWVDEVGGEVWGVVMLTPEEQAAFIDEAPGVFEPVKGKWGERGATRVRLKAGGKRAVRRALEAAWRGKKGK